MLYALKLFDRPLLDFEMQGTGGDFRAHVLSCPNDSRDFLPVDWGFQEGRAFCDGRGFEQAGLGTSLLDDNLTRWLKSRSIPSNRAYVGSFLSKIGPNERDVRGIIDVRKRARVAFLRRGLSGSFAVGVERS